LFYCTICVCQLLLKTLLIDCSHLCASVTKQYNLVPAKERWCCATGKVTPSLAESNGSLPPGGWLIVTCWLTAYTPGSAPDPTLGKRVWEAFTFTFLPVGQRVTAVLVWKCLLSRALDSESTDQYSFAEYGPRILNRPSTALRSPKLTLFTFKRQLKTHLFWH